MYTTRVRAVYCIIVFLFTLFLYPIYYNEYTDTEQFYVLLCTFMYLDIYALMPVYSPGF